MIMIIIIIICKNCNSIVSAKKSNLVAVKFPDQYDIRMINKI